MDEPLHDIDKLFLDNIEGHTEYPPKKVWDHIEAGLDKTSAVVYRKKYEKAKRAALILLLLITGILIYELVSNRRGKNDPDENTSKGSAKESVALETSNDRTKTAPGQAEKNTMLQVTDSSQVSVKQDAATSVQHDKIEYKPGTKEEEKIITPANNISGQAPGKKTGINSSGDYPVKDKSIRQEQKPALTDNPGAVPVNNKTGKTSWENMGITKSRDDNNKKGKNLTGDHVLTNDKIVENKNTDPLPVQPEEAERKIPGVRLRNESLAGQSASSAIIARSLTIASINYSPILPVISLSRPTTNEIAKHTTRPVKINSAKPGLSLTLFASPNAAWNNLKDDKPHHAGGGGNRVEDHEAIKRGEHNNFSYTGGLKLSYAFNKRLAVQTGLNYTSFSTGIDPKLIFADRDNNGEVRYRFDCSSGYSFLLPHNGQSPNRGDSLVVSDSKNSLSYAGIPLAVEYRLLTGKFSVSAIVGGQENILLKGKTSTTFGKGTASETTAAGNTEAMKSAYFSAITGISGELKLNKKLSLTLTPAGQFGLTPINKGASVKTNTSYFSLGAGLKLRL